MVKNPGGKKTRASQSKLKSGGSPRVRGNVIARQLQANGAWCAFSEALAQTITDLGEGEYLVVSRKRAQAFVQFAGQGADGLRAEAISNYYLDARSRLSRQARARLIALGWSRPTYVPKPGAQEPIDGSSNFFVDAARPVPYERLAEMSVSALRDVYGARHPGELQYYAFSDDPGTIRFPSLRISREDRNEADQSDPSVCMQEVDLTWKLVRRPDESGVFVSDQKDRVVAHVEGRSDEEAFERAVLIAHTPIYYDAVGAALIALKGIAQRRIDPLAAASELIPMLESVLANPLGGKVH